MLNQSSPPLPALLRRPLPVVLATVLCAAALSCGACHSEPKEIPRYRAEVIATFPHDATAYTQGLLVHGDHFFESTGRNGESTVREVVIETGEVLRRVSLPYRFFGEGIAMVDDRLYQLTWQSQEGRVYDRDSLDFLRKFTYEGQGWGLAHDGERLVMSDGTDVLRVFEPEDYTLLTTIQVHADGKPVQMLNELEFVEGELWANVWREPWIARIDPASGKVVGWIDLSGIFAWWRLSDPDAVPNGIAYDPATERLFVTGKFWPNVFEVKVVPVE